MGRLDQAKPYNWVECESAAAPIRLLGPSNEVYPALSKALSCIRLSSPTRSVGTNIISSFVRALNAAIEIVPAPAALCESGFPGFRRFQTAYLTSTKAALKAAKFSPGAQWVFVDRKDHGAVAGALAAICSVASWLKDDLFEGRDPTRTDRWNAGGADARIVRDDKGKITSDTGRRYRMVSDGGKLPRANDPRIFSRWMEAAQRLPGVSDETILISGMMNSTGARSFTVRSLTLFDFLVDRPFPNVIRGPDKGSRGVRTLAILLQADIEASVTAYIAKRHPQAFKEWQARVPGVEARLAEIPLFISDEGTSFPYWKFHSEFMEVSRAAALTFVDFESGVRTVEFVTPHQLRHEHVFRSLDWISTLPGEEQAQARADLIFRMGWRSGEQMLRWYSNFFETERSIVGARKVQTHQPEEHRGEGEGSDRELSSILSEMMEMTL